MTLIEELDNVDVEIKRLEARRREIYAESLKTVREEDKVCADFLAEMMAHESPFGRPIEYPTEIRGIVWRENQPPVYDKDAEGWVAVRPCAPEYENRTLLGIHIGRIALGCSCSLDKNGLLHLGHTMHNPLIYMPDVGKTVLGSGSWWGHLRKPEDLKQITDADINNVWYVRVLRELSEQPSNNGKPTESRSE